MYTPHAAYRSLAVLWALSFGIHVYECNRYFLIQSKSKQNLYMGVNHLKHVDVSLTHGARCSYAKKQQILRTSVYALRPQQGDNIISSRIHQFYSHHAVSAYKKFWLWWPQSPTLCEQRMIYQPLLSVLNVNTGIIWWSCLCIFRVTLPNITVMKFDGHVQVIMV